MKKVIAIACVALGLAAVAAPKVKIDKIENTRVWSTKRVTYTVSDVPTDIGCFLAFDVTAYSKTKSINKGAALNGTFTEMLDTAAIFGETRKDPHAKIRVSVEKWADLEPVQLWENGPYFAKCNVGAKEPHETGYYFWWGDTVGYKRNANNDGWVSAKDGATSIEFSADKSPANTTYNKSINQLYNGGNGYIDANGVDGKLKPEYDAARKHLGAPWRMPTEAELFMLNAYCPRGWTDDWEGTGKAGVIVWGIGSYASNSIFLPAAGYGEGSSLNAFGLNGGYWSSMPGNDIRACSLILRYEDTVLVCGTAINSCYGCQVRPVRGFAE